MTLEDSGGGRRENNAGAQHGRNQDRDVQVVRQSIHNNNSVQTETGTMPSLSLLSTQVIILHSFVIKRLYCIAAMLLLHAIMVMYFTWHFSELGGSRELI